MRVIGCAALLFAAGTLEAQSLQAQSLAARVTQTDGTVQVIYPSRPDVCGDGVGMLNFGRTRYNGYSGYDEGHGRCVAGPARVVATVMSGEVTRLRTYVGPVRTSDARTIEVSANDAAGWLKQLIASSTARVAQDAMLPLVIADAQDPSPALLAVARDDNRPTSVRRTALTYLSSAVNRHLGIDDASSDNDEDEMRRQAVFVLSQRSHGENSAELMEVARSSKHPAARRDAIFWLAQTGDVRQVADLYAELMR